MTSSHSTPSFPERWLPRLAFIAGAVIAGGLLASWTVEAEAGSPRVNVVFTSQATGELEVSPIGEMAAAQNLDLEPQDGPAPIRGTFTIRNQTPVPLLVRVGAEPVTKEIDDLLGVEIADSDRTLFDGTLGELRDGSRRGVELAPGKSAELELRSEMVASSANAYAERRQEIPLTLITEEATRR